MKMTRYIGVMLFSLFILFGLTFAEDFEQTVEDFNVDSAQDKIEKLNGDIDDLVKKLNLLDEEKMQWWANISEEYKEVRKEIVYVIQDITQTKNNLESVISKISSYKTQILKNYTELSWIKEDIAITRKNIEDFSLFLYKMENDTFTNGDFDLIKSFIKSDNMAVTTVNEEIISIVIQKLQEVLWKLEAEKDKHSQVLDKLLELNDKTYTEIEDYNTMLLKQEQKRAYLSQFIELYQSGIEWEKSFQNIFENNKDFHFAISDMVSNISLKLYSDEFKAKLQEVAKDEVVGDTVHTIWRPVYPAEEITSYFKDSTFEEENGFPQLWIEIKSPAGSPVYSSKDWVVYKVSKGNIFEINRVMIIHPDNYVSVYAYLDDIILEEWDVVQRWELIWYSWGRTDDNLWFVSQNATIKYMIFKDWVALDPLTILDLSVIKDNVDIPKEYKIKYLNDKYSREIDITELRFMDGDTVDERAQTFLSKYAVWPYSQVGFWEEVVEWTNIDRDMVICIGFAESTLWQYLATDNNIGNVWNNDSGDRIAFDNPVLWARMIAHTLNNRHLWHYHTVLDLSRYWNDDGMIYASSPINWQTNVTKCLSMIKWYYVPDEFPFRTGPNPNLM